MEYQYGLRLCYVFLAFIVFLSIAVIGTRGEHWGLYSSSFHTSYHEFYASSAKTTINTTVHLQLPSTSTTIPSLLKTDITPFSSDDEYTLRMKANYTQTPLAKDITINPGVRFSGVWPMLSEMPYREHRDTACPLTPKDRFKKKLIKRWPDAIGIGFPKCGTGALGFIDCHSKFVFRESEPAFWNQPSRTMHGLRAYALPSASADEILIEKTPDYSKGSGTYLLHMAEQIKQNIPNVKLIVMLCDPATRAFSHIKHQTKDVGFSTKWSVNDPMEALRLLGRYMGTFNHPELIGTSPRLPVMQPIIDYGNYFTQLQPFFEVFDKSQFHFVDGGGIVTNPEAEFSKLESFFDVPNELMFKFNVTKGFPCLHRPVKMCLSAAKGRTRGTGSHIRPDDALPEEMKMIRDFYKDEMENIFKLVLPSVSLDQFCSEPDLHRFAWLSLILCKDVQR